MSSTELVAAILVLHLLDCASPPPPHSPPSSSSSRAAAAAPAPPPLRDRALALLLRRLCAALDAALFDGVARLWRDVTEAARPQVRAYLARLVAAAAAPPPPADARPEALGALQCAPADFLDRLRRFLEAPAAAAPGAAAAAAVAAAAAATALHCARAVSATLGGLQGAHDLSLIHI